MYSCKRTVTLGDRLVLETPGVGTTRRNLFPSNISPTCADIVMSISEGLQTIDVIAGRCSLSSHIIVIIVIIVHFIINMSIDVFFIVVVIIGIIAIVLRCSRSSELRFYHVSVLS